MNIIRKRSNITWWVWCISVILCLTIWGAVVFSINCISSYILFWYVRKCLVHVHFVQSSRFIQKWRQIYADKRILACNIRTSVQENKLENCYSLLVFCPIFQQNHMVTALVMVKYHLLSLIIQIRCLGKSLFLNSLSRFSIFQKSLKTPKFSRQFSKFSMLQNDGITVILYLKFNMYKH